MRFDPEQVALYLTSRGHGVLTIDPETDDADACVWLTPRLGVQVSSFGGLSVNLHNPPSEDFWVRHHDVQTLERMRMWVVTLQEELAAEAAKAPAVWLQNIMNAAPGQKMQVGIPHLRRAVSMLLLTHQTLDEDARRTALDHLRAVHNLIGQQLPIDALNPTGRLG